jgi:hypothetical protein
MFKDGYDPEGYDFDGVDTYGYDRTGLDKEGYDRDGYNPSGFDRDGYDRTGFNESGFNRDGVDQEGYTEQGFDQDGYDREGYDANGWNAENLNREGVARPAIDTYDFDGTEFFDGDASDTEVLSVVATAIEAAESTEIYDSDTTRPPGPQPTRERSLLEEYEEASRRVEVTYTTGASATSSATAEDPIVFVNGRRVSSSSRSYLSPESEELPF